MSELTESVDIWFKVCVGLSMPIIAGVMIAMWMRT